MLISGTKLECTCVIIWLFKYFYSFNMNYDRKPVIDYEFVYGDSYINHTTKYCLNKDFNKKASLCNFEDRLNKCNQSNYGYTKTKNDLFQNDIEILFLIKWLQLLIFLFIQPVLCIIGVITNLLTIFTLKQKDASKKGHDCSMVMYNHIFYNSIFNIVYCVLTLNKPLSVCIFELSPFCSSVYQLYSVQYFKIVFIYFFGNAIKLCCNLSYTSFALSRFSLSANKKSGFYEKFEKLNLKLYYLLMFFICLAFSVFNMFEYQLNEIYNPFKSFPAEKYDIDNCNKNTFNCRIFRTFNIVNDLIKDVGFLFINLIIDTYLLKILSKSLKNKIKLNEDPKKIRSAAQSKKRLNHFIFINCIIYVLAYFPEFILRILILSVNQYIISFCFYFISCNDLTEITQIFNFISICFQFFIFKHFNRTFNEKFNMLKMKINNKLIFY
jgi:hypothetical protein